MNKLSKQTNACGYFGVNYTQTSHIYSTWVITFFFSFFFNSLNVSFLLMVVHSCDCFISSLFNRMWTNFRNVLLIDLQIRSLFSHIVWSSTYHKCEIFTLYIYTVIQIKVRKKYQSTMSEHQEPMNQAGFFKSDLYYFLICCYIHPIMAASVLLSRSF